MNSNLCLAQAQYLFFRKARDSKRQPADLSKVCAQISLYFQKAFECNQMSATLRGYDNSTFGNLLGYHAKLYMAMAYNYLSEAQLLKVQET